MRMESDKNPWKNLFSFKESQRFKGLEKRRNSEDFPFSDCFLPQITSAIIAIP